MPGHAVPVGRAGTIVAIRAGQTAVGTVIQVATAPRGIQAAELGELNAATRRFIAPFLNSGFGGG